MPGNRRSRYRSKSYYELIAFGEDLVRKLGFREQIEDDPDLIFVRVVQLDTFDQQIVKENSSLTIVTLDARQINYKPLWPHCTKRVVIFELAIYDNMHFKSLTVCFRTNGNDFFS